MSINFLGLPQHFENTEQLREAMRQNLISEPEYKKMSGYDASQNIWGLGDFMGPFKPAANLATSGIYNLGKSIFTPDEYFDPKTYQARVGPIQSVGYNVEGALGGLSPEELERYEAILDLDRKSLTDTWSQEDLHDFTNVSADEKGTIVPDNRVMHAGFNLQYPRIFSELKAEEAPLFNVDKVREMIAKSAQDGPWKMRSGTAENMILPQRKPEDDLIKQPNFMGENYSMSEPVKEQSRGMEFLKNLLPTKYIDTLNKVIRPGADESYGGVARLYPEEIARMKIASSSGDPRVDDYGINIVSGFGNYDQYVKDWNEKYGDMIYKTDFMNKKQQHYKNVLARIQKRQEIEAQKRAEQEAAKNIGGGWTQHDEGGGHVTFRGPSGASHKGYSNTPQGIAAATSEWGSS